MVKRRTDLKKEKMFNIYYSKIDKDHCIDFLLVQCNESTPLALDIFRCFSLISTKFAVVIAIASSHRFQCNSHTGASRICPLVGKCKILFLTEVHNFQMIINVFKA